MNDTTDPTTGAVTQGWASTSIDSAAAAVKGVLTNNAGVLLGVVAVFVGFKVVRRLIKGAA